MFRRATKIHLLARDGVVARVRAGRLDADLAAGIPSWESPVYARRALQLTSRRRVRSLARSLERTLKEADSTGPIVISSTVPVCRSRVRAARPQILTIVSRLRTDRPVSATGVARLNCVLSDGSGPCYTAGDTGTLAEVLQDVYDTLEIID
jgi:hypothetical protein